MSEKKVGECLVEIKADDQLSGLLEQVTRRMEKAANLAMVAAGICSATLLMHALILKFVKK